VVTASSLSYASAATPDSPDQKPRWLTQMVEPFGDTAGRPDPAPPGRVAAAAPTRSTKSCQRRRHRGRGRGTRGHRPRDTGRPHRTVDSGSWTSHARTLDVHPDTGHRTRGRDRVLGQGDLDTAGTGQTSRTTTTTRWDAEPWTCGRHLLRSARRRLGDDEVPASARLPTALPGPARSLCQRPSGASAHCSPRTISGRA
jgi:hypothetical protein